MVENALNINGTIHYCTVPLIFSEIVLEVLAISWYTKRNGGDSYGKTKNISYNFNG